MFAFGVLCSENAQWFETFQSSETFQQSEQTELSKQKSVLRHSLFIYERIL